MRHGRSGLAYRLIVFVMMIVGGTLFWVALNPAFEDVHSALLVEADTTAATTGAGWLAQIWTWAPILVVFIAMIALLRAAVVERRRSI